MCSNGETECAHYVLQNGACGIEICPTEIITPLPPSPPAPGPGCAQGGMCSPGEGCGTAVPAGSNECSTNCECVPAGYFECTQTCPAVDAGTPGEEDAGEIPGCSPGLPCSPNSGCGGGSAGGGCVVSCSCGANGVLECTKDCAN